MCKMNAVLNKVFTSITADYETHFKAKFYSCMFSPYTDVKAMYSFLSDVTFILPHVGFSVF